MAQGDTPAARGLKGTRPGPQRMGGAERLVTLRMAGQRDSRFPRQHLVSDDVTDPRVFYRRFQSRHGRAPGLKEEGGPLF